MDAVNHLKQFVQVTVHHTANNTLCSLVVDATKLFPHPCYAIVELTVNAWLPQASYRCGLVTKPCFGKKCYLFFLDIL